MTANLQSRNPSHPPSHHILLVEDEPNVARGLGMVLNDEGYDVDVAPTGNSALDMFRGNGFDLLISDLRLPDIDGLEVISSIKKERPGVNVIIITGYPSVSSAVKAVRMGVLDYLRKPFTDEELVTAVKDAFQEVDKSSMEELLVETKRVKLIQKQEVIRALETAAEDYTFAAQMLEGSSRALEGYDLSSEAKAAIISGDLKWIRENVGELTEEQLEWIYKRLEVEAW